MKETLYQVAEAISEAQPEYRKKYIPVVARVHGCFDGNTDTFWLLNGQKNYSMLSVEGLKKYGQLVPKNSFIATRILNSELGVDIEYKLKNNIKRLVDHHIKATTKADLENREISIWGDSQKYSYDDINSFLRELRKKQADIERNEEIQRQIEEQRQKEKDAHERGVLTKKLNKLEEERRILTMQQEDMTNLTKFIRQQGKLRFNPILDPIQNRIKTFNLFDGTTIVIDGGPGTGKTTTMIQRLKYLTDWDAIEEDYINSSNLYQLSAAQRDHLHEAIKEQRDWLFFSPSKLLKEYLSDAMNREGLVNTNAKVWHWAEYRNKVLRENYLLIDPSNDNSPFKSSRSEKPLFYNNEAIINGFLVFLLDSFKQIVSRFPKIEDEEKNYLWMSIALNIKKRFDGCESFTMQQFAQLFNSLEQTYSKDCRELLAENRHLVNSISDEIYLISKDNESIYDQLVSLANVQIVEQTDDVEEEQDGGDYIEIEITEADSQIISMIRSWFKRYCYSKKNSEIRLTSRQMKLSDLLLPLLREEHIKQMDRVGELALFEQYAKYTRGIRSNLFGGFAAKYKRFRRQALANKDNSWDLTELESLLKRREGKELHPQEQSLLIGCINNLVKMVLKISREPINHPFVDAYKEIARPIIGIDEATDFCECDIYAMQSLLYNDYNSLTLCGDLMQRLTETGITSWDKIKPILPGMVPVEMQTSYRQSTSLLNVAKALYKDTIGEEPSYKAYMKSKKVPSPMAFVSSDESKKIKWIEERIDKVYKAYGKRLPSIAIFLNNKNDIKPFVEALRDTDFIFDAGIEIVDGSEGNVLASSNQIRVYPIDVVKGMEFDVVFFHNIDNASVDSTLIKRYIYVGVSRAAFFLGVTFTKEEGNEDLIKYFERTKDNW